MLEVRKLSKAFPAARKRGNDKLTEQGGAADPRQRGKLFYAVEDVSLRVEPGVILGLLGPNGAGKTTLLRLLSTALVPTSGTAMFDGMDIVASPLNVRKHIGFLSGTTGVYGRLTAREMVAYYGELHGLRGKLLTTRIDELFATLEMDSFADVRNDQLSTGMKQKVSIARTLVHDPKIIILDEPTTGLDVVAADIVVKLIAQCRDQGKTVLFSTHHMHEVDALCSQVAVVDRGRLCFSGSVDEMRAHTGETRLDRAFLRLVGRGGEA